VTHINYTPPRPHHPRVEAFKAAITGSLYQVIDEHSDEDGPMALAALAEVTAQFGCMMFGKKLTLDLLTEMSRMVTTLKD
jgi:hypothetical protein